ncbi:hypothetical protein [Neptuniibacter sp. QD37_11]|uniref:hypothetical protein n=1 Tax=Neptuniibacter sp. QD37_11 TaxID=3398209 RepID=UPI0039F5A503
MSTFNKAKDRDDNGRPIHKYRGKHAARYDNTPTWHVNLFMNRPRRAKDRHLCRLVRNGRDYSDMHFSLGNHKPHVYYW